MRRNRQNTCYIFLKKSLNYSTKQISDQLFHFFEPVFLDRSQTEEIATGVRDVLRFALILCPIMCPSARDGRVSGQKRGRVNEGWRRLTCCCHLRPSKEDVPKLDSNHMLQGRLFPVRRGRRSGWKVQHAPSIVQEAHRPVDRRPNMQVTDSHLGAICPISSKLSIFLQVPG